MVAKFKRLAGRGTEGSFSRRYLCCADAAAPVGWGFAGSPAVCGSIEGHSVIEQWPNQSMSQLSPYGVVGFAPPEAWVEKCLLPWPKSTRRSFKVTSQSESSSIMSAEERRLCTMLYDC